MLLVIMVYLYYFNFVYTFPSVIYIYGILFEFSIVQLFLWFKYVDFVNTIGAC